MTDAGAADAPVYWRDHLPLGARIEGPALVEQMDTTVLIEPGWRATGDALGNLILEAAPTASLPGAYFRQDEGAAG